MKVINEAVLPRLEATGSPVPQNSSKLHEAAQQFEALLIGEMLKSARESGSSGWLGTDEDTADDSAMDIGQAEFAQALASGGGLGLAKVIEQQMSRQIGVQSDPAVSQSPAPSEPQAAADSTTHGMTLNGTSSRIRHAGAFVNRVPGLEK